MKALVLILISIFFGATGQIMMKWGTNQIALANGSGLYKVLSVYLTNVPLLSGLAFYGISAVFWVVAIGKVELSFAYPMVALGYVLVVIASFFLFHEHITFYRIWGLLLIVIGVVFIAKS